MLLVRGQEGGIGGMHVCMHVCMHVLVDIGIGGMYVCMHVLVDIASRGSMYDTCYSIILQPQTYQICSRYLAGPPLHQT